MRTLNSHVVGKVSEPNERHIFCSVCYGEGQFADKVVARLSA